MLKRERTAGVAEDRLWRVIMMVRYENKAARIADLFGRPDNLVQQGSLQSAEIEGVR